MLKNIFLKLNFQHKGHLYTNSLFYILDIYCKRLLFQFLRCAIRLDIPFLTGFQKRHYCLKNGHILLKKVLLKLIFQHKGHLYANSLFYILSFRLKCLQLFSRGIRMHISILTEVQKGQSSG